MRTTVWLFLILCLMKSYVECVVPVLASSKDDCVDEEACGDKLGFESIKHLHRQLDDDRNGNVDVTETDGFLREELQYENGGDRHKAFHATDKHITVKELWELWKRSSVHNWTVDETMEWLVESVELPQYADTFHEHSVDGSTLPRLAVNNMHFLTNILGIKDPIHKQKIALKAMDVVLFGAPKQRNYLKDVLLATSVLVAFGGVWFAYVQKKRAEIQMKKFEKDLSSLAKAENELINLQRELEKASKRSELKEDELVDKLKGDGLSDGGTSPEDLPRVKELEMELARLNEEYERAHQQLQEHKWVPPQQLQLWLQLTHEMEVKSYNGKKTAAENQLIAAREACEKLKKKRSSLMGSLHMAHSSSFDDIDKRMVQAKTALMELTQDLQERLARWKHIEHFTGFTIVQNPGLAYLETVLYAGAFPRASVMAGSQDDDSDMDSISTYNGHSMSTVQKLVHKSAHLFLAPVPPSYANNISCWQQQQDHVISRSSPSRANGGSSTNLTTISSCIYPSSNVHHLVPNGGNISPSITRRSRSAGPDVLDPHFNHLQPPPQLNKPISYSTDNLIAVDEEEDDMSDSVSTYMAHDSNGKPALFQVGDENYHPENGPRLAPMPRPNALHLLKSHSHDQSSPPKEIPPANVHSQSDSVLLASSVIAANSQLTAANSKVGSKRKTTFPFQRSVTTHSVLKSPATATPDDDSSQDSSVSGSLVSQDGGEVKKKKKKSFILASFRRSKDKNQ